MALIDTDSNQQRFNVIRKIVMLPNTFHEFVPVSDVCDIDVTVNLLLVY